MGEQNWYAVHDLTNFFNFYYMKEDHRSYRRNSFAVEKRKPEKFLFETAKVASITAMIFFHIILHHEVLIYDFHIFITSSSSFYRFITNLFNGLLPAGLLVQLVERCTCIAEVKGSNLVQARKFFFTPSFRNFKSCVYNWDNLLSYNSSLRSSHVLFSYIHNLILSHCCYITPLFAVQRLKNFKSGILLVVWNDATVTK